MYDNFTIWFFFNSIKPDEVDKPIANETSLQFWHNEKLSSLYFTLIDRKPTSFIMLLLNIVWAITSSRLFLVLYLKDRAVLAQNCPVFLVSNWVYDQQYE